MIIDLIVSLVDVQYNLHCFGTIDCDRGFDLHDSHSWTFESWISCCPDVSHAISSDLW